MAEREIRWPAASRREYAYVIKELTDPARIRELLVPRVEYTAYALGQLEPGLFERTHWFWAKGDTGSGLALHSRGGLGDATFVMGDPDAIAAILSIHPGTQHTYATCQPQHLEVLQRTYRLASQQTMIRMGVTRETFAPARGMQTVPLGGIDIRRVNSLYGTEGGPSYYIPEHIDSGVYRGIVVDGRLVAVAGTHVVSPEEGVAVVGNVFTHPRYRGRGYATLVTGAVTAALLKHCRDVVLTVDPKNIPAVRAYWRLGYSEVCRLIEAPVTRRDTFGLGAAAQRSLARWRGRGLGVEIVK